MAALFVRIKANCHLDFSTIFIIKKVAYRKIACKLPFIQ